MKIIDILRQDRPTLSFEVFPPKTSDSYETVAQATQEIAALRPDFMSVTYGAGGGTSSYTIGIASELSQRYGVDSLAHLTCASSTREHVHAMLAEMKAKGIQNVLALRGDIPEGGAPAHDYQYAAQLVRDIKASGDFCVGGACYPEGHPEAPTKNADIDHLKEKMDAGCEFFTTQMFFDNNILYNFLYRIREKGITVPVVAGIMPVTNGKQIARICKLSGTYLPEKFKAIVDRFGDNPAAMRQAGVAYAAGQIIDLIANGVTHIHVYSMNKPSIAADIQASLSEVLKP
ncbi:MAG TPA: methylenetetrahydrofolate reductase [NAD(P)H] [Candidatus Flavonifractor merdigallinarum]|uniref:Methylenetetrahydrofolate reductase n=1 Tax=Candidatus Flavonifractor merdigallinarum TaxID=2838589 RepID=A0A9D1Y9L1_9FIRM|nr:methylenetetrahydrofolate reductase [NAD(P)H] [Candidatus Flavonifractor merdigallinarum]